VPLLKQQAQNIYIVLAPIFVHGHVFESAEGIYAIGVHQYVYFAVRFLCRGKELFDVSFIRLRAPTAIASPPASVISFTTLFAPLSGGRIIHHDLSAVGRKVAWQSIRPLFGRL